MAVRGVAGHDEAVCCWCAGDCLCYRHVSALADEDALGGVVSQYGYAGTDWSILRYEHLPSYSLRSYVLRGAAGTLAVP